MRLILTDDDGTILDSMEVEREDWDAAQASAVAALALLNELESGNG